jgi:hypothetical protein
MSGEGFWYGLRALGEGWIGLHGGAIAEPSRLASEIVSDGNAAALLIDDESGCVEDRVGVFSDFRLGLHPRPDIAGHSKG